MTGSSKYEKWDQPAEYSTTKKTSTNKTALFNFCPSIRNLQFISFASTIQGFCQKKLMNTEFFHECEQNSAGKRCWTQLMNGI